MDNPQTVSPVQAADLMRQGAVLIDIRESDEYAREHVPGARNYPLTRIDQIAPGQTSGGVLIFHCRSGARTKGNAARLAAAAPACESYVLDGGIEAWKAAGLPVQLDRNQPIDIMRQVQIVAGGLVLAGVVLGALVSPAFYLLSGVVGAGLLFAGISGFCGMAKLLGLMPWNRRLTA
jgi:rhodanese-related sulfurtransferase